MACSPSSLSIAVRRSSSVAVEALSSLAVLMHATTRTRTVASTTAVGDLLASPQPSCDNEHSPSGQPEFSRSVKSWAKSWSCVQAGGAAAISAPVGAPYINWIITAGDYAAKQCQELNSSHFQTKSTKYGESETGKRVGCYNACEEMRDRGGGQGAHKNYNQIRWTELILIKVTRCQTIGRGMTACRARVYLS